MRSAWTPRLFSSAIFTASSIDSGVPLATGDGRGGATWRTVGIADGAPLGTATGVAGVCPKADIGIPETNMRAAAPKAHGRAIEARICWCKRLTVVSTEMKTKAVGGLQKQDLPPVIRWTGGSPPRFGSVC